MASEAPFKRGDWVIITHKHKPLCVIGQVAERASSRYGDGFVLENTYRFDPEGIDDLYPNEWPAYYRGSQFVYEKLGEPPAALPEERL